MRVLTVVDSDSYVKWGAAMVDAMPEDWERDVVLLRTPALPSGEQLRSALAGTAHAGLRLPHLDLAELRSLLTSEQPDVVMLSVRGPVIRVLVGIIAEATHRRPIIVTGMPGITFPERMHTLYLRSQVDLMILHSKRELRVHRALAEALGMEQDFALATLPFLPERHGAHAVGDDIVFAAQAKVPRGLEDRERIVDWLIQTARAHPRRTVVLKLRGRAGEAQTHSERYPLDVLLAGRGLPPNLLISTAPMGEHLATAGVLVTVSSTAAIEAIALDVPVLLLDDFGVGAALINLVFEGSGLFGSSRDLVAGRSRLPLEAWLDDNYFHPAAEENWIAAIELLAAQRELGDIPLRRRFRGSFGGNLRRVWDRKIALGPYDRSPAGYVALAVGVPLRGLVRAARRLRRHPPSGAMEVASPAEHKQPGVGAA